MGERITSRRLREGKSSPFNWLKWLDQEVRKFPSTASWSQYPPFQFARCRLFMMVLYPQLQRLFPDEVLYEELSRGENQILGHPEARHALDGLNDQQRNEVAALFLDTDIALMTYKAHRRSANRVHKLAGEAPSRTRMLTRKLEKARRALEDLRKYAASLDEMLGWEHVRTTKICIETLQKLKEDSDPEFYQSIKTEYPALEDPMRCMHAQAENDSAIEAFLNRVHEFFGSAAVVISHHLRKRDRNPGHQHRLKDDMRVWADEGRGSGAITAHADVIVCQEREVEWGVEMLHWGAYLRDAGDIEPMVLRESSSESFLWQVASDVPPYLAECLESLRQAGGEFPNRSAAVAVLQSSIGAGRSTAFARLNELLNRGLLTSCGGALKVKEMVDEAGKA